MRKTTVALVAAALVAACSGGPAITEEQRSQAIASLTADVYQPGYSAVAEQAQGLLDAIESFCAGSGELSTVRAAWNEAMNAWLRTEAFRFGPARSMRLESGVVFLVDEEKVAAAMASTTSPESVAELGADARGLHGLEIALFSDHPADACSYLLGAAMVVAQTAADLDDAWQGIDGYGQELTTEMESQDGVELAVNDLRLVVDDLVFYRLDAGASGEGLVQPPRAPLNAQQLVESVRRGYLGVESGLSDLVRTTSADTDERTRSLLEDLEAQVAQMTTDPSTAEPALATARELRTIITTEIASLLAATLLLGDADGDA